MKALILAAGKGERLGALTSNRPKAMVEVLGKPLIDYVLDFLDHPAIDKICIAGGYKFEILKTHLINTSTLLHLNTAFHEGSVRTIITAEDFLDDDFILLNADHIYPKRLLDVYIEQQKGLTIACDFDRHLGADDMKIKLNGNKNLIKISKGLTDYDGGYVGSTFVPKSALKDYKNALHETYETIGKSANAEAVIGLMAEKGHKIGIADLSGIGWLEVDTKEDLAHAEL